MNEQQEIQQFNNTFYFTQGIVTGVFIGMIVMCAILRFLHATPRQIEDRWRIEAEKHGAGVSKVDTNGEYVRFEWSTNVLMERK